MQPGKPIIGITPSPVEDVLPHGTFTRYAMSSTYTEAVEAAGGVPFVIPPQAGNIDEIVGWLSPYLSGACPGGCRVLDVGGGTGALASRLSTTIDAEVVVLDPTPEMLRYVPEQRLVSPVLGTAEAIPFEDDTFHAVIVTDAFHHFRDQVLAISEFHRVVRPGGGVIVVELDPRSVLMRLVVAIERLLGEPGAFFAPEQLSAFMSRHGIDGTCTGSGTSYRFVGSVRDERGSVSCA
jgi:demethylmenaquinone methyltransferase/2-methoxy-6-polyprenyl-1,4-benzoquinol methylase